MKEPKEADAVLCRADGGWICVMKRNVLYPAVL